MVLKCVTTILHYIMYGIRTNDMKNGLYCSAGYDWFSIGSEGRVSVCNSLIYRTDNGIYLGNIIKDDIKLREKNEWFRCPNQECQQICDRHWSKKQVYKDDIIIDEQDIVNPSAYVGRGRSVSILFAPLWKCNYSCKYCKFPNKTSYPNLIDVCDVHLPSEWMNAFDRFISTNKIEGGIWHTNGGEPLFYDGIDQLFSYFYKKNFKIALTTNASVDVYKKIVLAVPPEAFGIINCSLHPSNKNFQWEMFKSRIQLLKELHYPISINFVGYPDQLMLVPEYAAWCESVNVSFTLIPLIGHCDGFEFKTINEYPEQLKQIINKYTRKDLTDFNKFKCGKRLM